MFGAYLATHLSIWLENFEVIFSSLTKHFSTTIYVITLIQVIHHYFCSTSAKKWMMRTTEDELPVQKFLEYRILTFRKETLSFIVILEYEKREIFIHIMKRNLCCEIVPTSDAQLKKALYCYPT